jgi:stage V sporulation protein G
MTEIIISNIEINPIRPRNGIVGFCSFVLDNRIYVGSVAIHTCLKNDLGYRLVYPTRKTKSGDLISCVYPINRQTGDTIERAVIARYKAIVEDVLIYE